MTELEIAVAKKLENWMNLPDYPELVKAVVEFHDEWMPAASRVPGDPRYRAVEIEPIIQDSRELDPYSPHAKWV